MRKIGTEMRGQQEEWEKWMNEKEEKITEEIEIVREIKGRSRRERKEDAAAQKRFRHKETKR